MPIYEYQCNACGKQLSIFQRRIGTEVAGRCEHCGGADLRRLISRFAVVRSASAAFDDGGMDDLDPDDPAAMERWARGMGEEMGTDFGDDDGEFDDYGDFGSEE